MEVLAKREPTISNPPPTRSKLRRKNLKKISETILTPNNAKTTANHPPTEVADLAVEDVEDTANQVPIAVINAVVLIAESVHPKLVRVLTSVATAEKIHLRTSRKNVAMEERMIKIKIDFLIQIIW